MHIRFTFNKRGQQTKKPFDHFLKELLKLVQDYEYLKDNLLKNRIVAEIENYQFMEEVLGKRSQLSHKSCKYVPSPGIKQRKVQELILNLNTMVS